MSDSRPLWRTDALVTETMDGELLVYDLDGDVALQLNRTAALVWRSCNGQRTVPEILALVVEELGETADEDVVLMALDSLSEHDLISAGYMERDGAAVALSRRRFFRRVGVTGAAALSAPVVYSMSVPLAAAAVSGGGVGSQTITQSTLSNTGAGNTSTGAGNTGTRSTGANTGDSGTGNTGANTGAGNTGAGNTGAGSSGAGSSGAGSSGSGDSYP